MRPWRMPLYSAALSKNAVRFFGGNDVECTQVLSGVTAESAR